MKLFAPPETRFYFSVMDFPHVPIPGKVTYCEPISGDTGAGVDHNYRIGLQFDPRSDEEREAQLSLYRRLSDYVATDPSKK